MIEPVFLGIDFGARHAGTTAICHLVGDALVVCQTEKGADADSFCRYWIDQLRPHAVMIDAPLSLPAAYHGNGEDYFYRKCDREAGAMSPLFLGGLTARAMQLANHYKNERIEFYEVYPKLVNGLLFPELPKPHGKEQLQALFRKAEATIEKEIKAEKFSIHAFDAVMAWYGGKRIFSGKAVRLGDAGEGFIYY